MPGPPMQMGMPGMGMPGMMPGMPGMGMDMNMMNMNPVALQEMLGAQMALMTHVAMNMGLVNPNNGQFVTPGQQGFPGQQQQQQQNPGGAQRGRGGATLNRGGRGGGGAGRGGHNPSAPEPAPVAAPRPAAPPAFTPPTRPASPSLCKFNTKCTNPACRYSHASPVATVESGLVLNVDACENKKNCTDPDCPKSHVSPAVLNPDAVPFAAAPQAKTAPSFGHGQHKPAFGAPTSRVPCKFGVACTRADCMFTHPPGRRLGGAGGGGGQSAALCKFGSGCTRAECPFQHPADRVLPGTFHRGLDANTPVVSVPTPSFHGALAGGSHNRSATFGAKALDATAQPFVPQGQAKEEEKEPAAAAA